MELWGWVRSPKGSGVCHRLLPTRSERSFLPSAGKHVPGLLTLCCNLYCVGRRREGCTQRKLPFTAVKLRVL